MAFSAHACEVTAAFRRRGGWSKGGRCGWQSVHGNYLRSAARALCRSRDEPAERSCNGAATALQRRSIPVACCVRHAVRYRGDRPCCRKRHTRTSKRSCPKNGSPLNAMIGTPQCPAACNAASLASSSASNDAVSVAMSRCSVAGNRKFRPQNSQNPVTRRRLVQPISNGSAQDLTAACFLPYTSCIFSVERFADLS
jgi:hypothetical protein